MILMELTTMTIIAIIIVFLILYEYVYKFYSKVKLYPRGTMPLPIVGNSLMLRNTFNQHLSYFFQNIASSYCDSYTFWLGTKPMVIINGISLAKEALNKNEFCDRCDPSLESKTNDLFIGGHKSWAIMNNSDELKLIRSLSVQSLRKYLSTNKISNTTHEIITETVNRIKQNENGNAFVPFKYIDSIFIRLLIQLNFAKKISFDDYLIDGVSKFTEIVQMNAIHLVVTEFIPLYKYCVNWAENKKVIADAVLVFDDLYRNNKQPLRTDICGNIGEALNSFANSAQNNNEANKYLSDSTMIGTMITLFFAASETTKTTFKWLLLLMCYYPEMQQKMRKEIDKNIGKTAPDMSDKEKCVYVNAFIFETLRYRNALPLSAPHMTSSDTVLGDISIPKGTMIIVNQLAILNDCRYWKNPDVFNPERFIDNDHNLVSSNIASFIPFSAGKRMCVGDKFAMTMLFLALSSLLQATNGMKFVLSDKQCTDLKPMNFGFILQPKIFKVCLVNN